MKLQGKVWKYGDNIDTDVIIPARYLVTTDPQALAAHCMEDIDAAFAGGGQPGDIIVGGTNFGCGSSREHAPISIKGAGVSCIIAESFARIFFRNAINIGLPVLECPEAVDDTESGDELSVDLPVVEHERTRADRLLVRCDRPTGSERVGVPAERSGLDDDAAAFVAQGGVGGRLGGARSHDIGVIDVIRLDLEHPDDLAGADVGAGQPVDELGRGAQRGDEEGRVAVERNQLTGRDPAVDREPSPKPRDEDNKDARQEHLGRIEGSLDAGHPMEDEREHDHGDERLQQGPADSEDRLPVADLQIAPQQESKKLSP